ncbi:MAG: transposase [Rhodoferax sp.]
MARLPRLSIPGYPHHVIQRGNNRQPVFLSEPDRQVFLDLLRDSAAGEGVVVHAYVLMDNHFHLLLTPSVDGALSRCMQALGRSYVRHVNRSHGRSGTLWEGRYRAALLQPEAYLLPCMAYLDLNPVRHGLVLQPQDWTWSSHAHYAGLRVDRWLTPHPLVWQLGNTPFDRESRYRAMVAQGPTAEQQAALTRSALAGWALGTPEFLAQLQQSTQRRLTRGRPGRPPRTG